MARTKKKDAATVIAEYLAKQPQQYQRPDKLVVGVRNISSETIAFPKGENDPEISLHARDARNGSWANSVGIVSYGRWQAIRKSKLYGNGLVVRDDSILGEVDQAAPPDDPKDLHPDHEKNAIVDLDLWIKSKTEDEIRRAVGEMTSEASLRRLWGAVDTEYERVMEGVDRKDEAAVRRAKRLVPAIYQLLDLIVPERLEDIDPLKRGDTTSHVFGDRFGRLERL